MNFINKTILAVLSTAISFTFFTACDKVEMPEKDKQEQQTGNGGSSTSGNESNKNPLEGVSVLTIEEAYDALVESEIVVRGYIVGATKSSMKNAVFRPPFSYDTNIILAERPVPDDTEEEYEALFFPVQLSSPSDKAVRAELNLQDNPANHNREVIICGVKQGYFSLPGLKNVYAYYWPEDLNNKE